MYTLRVFSPYGSGSYWYDLLPRVTIVGSSSEADIILQECGNEDVAAYIYPRKEVVELKAVPGVKVSVNGKRIRSAVLNCGDRICIGDAVLVLDKRSEDEKQTQLTFDPFPERIKHFVETVGLERDLTKLLKNLMQILLEQIGGSEAFIITLDQKERPAAFVSTGQQSSDDRYSDTIVQRVLESGEGIYLPNALSHPEFSSAKSIADLKLSSVLCSPVLSGGKVTGVIYIGSRSPSLSYAEKDLDALLLYAALAGMVIHHVEFIAQQHQSIQRLQKDQNKDGLIAECPAMRKVLGDVNTLAQSDISVLIEGETGTGKDVVAQLIHKKSARADKPFVVVNSSAIRGELMESELFGHKKGSFTGAVRDHKGLFDAADGGTLFLDEIGELDIALQAKLLRTLETGRIRPVGSAGEHVVDVRILCATNRNLLKMVEQNQFRSDLYYRIHQFCIYLPPVRERGEDIILLAYHFLHAYMDKYPHKEVTDFHPLSIKTLTSHPWPGNVRELASAVHRAVLAADSSLAVIQIDSGDQQQIESFEDATQQFQKRLIQRALAISEGNKERAAKILQMSRSTFFRYCASFGMTSGA